MATTKTSREEPNQVGIDKDKSDVKVIKKQANTTKDSENKDKNAANAKSNPGHYDIAERRK